MDYVKPQGVVEHMLAMGVFHPPKNSYLRTDPRVGVKKLERWPNNWWQVSHLKWRSHAHHDVYTGRWGGAARFSVCL